MLNHIFNNYENSHAYTAYEMHRASIYPVNLMANWGRRFHGSSMNPFASTEFSRTMSAGFEVLERIVQNYPKPEFGIEETIVDGKSVDILEEVVAEKTFCKLLHFKKDSGKKQPKLLIVAPMSGHYATLCRGTVRDLLPYFDMYVTDWVDAKTVPLSKGKFDLDDYIDYLMGFMKKLGAGLNIVAVCQPSVPVMAAVSIMSDRKSAYLPASMTLIGGPIDTTKSPTEVNNLAKERSDIWFERNVITRVPFNYPGFMRKVYPGFVQLTGFMSMNMERHVEAHMDLFNHLVEGDGDSADGHRRFYNEYLSVMDITAEFYMQTIKAVFQDHSLPEGKMVSNGRKIKPELIKDTALLCIEGGKDDISGIGQTKAAIDICKELPAKKKKYHLQKDVGHYGLFHGSKFRKFIVPEIKDFINKL